MTVQCSQVFGCYDIIVWELWLLLLFFINPDFHSPGPPIGMASTTDRPIQTLDSDR